jgi:hypothetical protein
VEESTTLMQGDETGTVLIASPGKEKHAGSASASGLRKELAPKFLFDNHNS